jgi:hypothetical protein
MTDAEAEQEAKRLARLIELSPHNFGHLAAALKSAYAKGAADERQQCATYVAAQSRKLPPGSEPCGDIVNEVLRITADALRARGGR